MQFSINDVTVAIVITTLWEGIVVFSFLCRCRPFSVICLKFVMEREAFDDEFYEGLEDSDYNDGWSEVSEPLSRV